MLRPYLITQLILSCLLCTASACCTAQDASHKTSIQPTTDFDQRFYYTPGEVQNVWGYRAGLLINEKYKLGVGGYYMNESTQTFVPAVTLNGTAGSTAILHKKLYLGTVYYEPYLIRRKLWESSVVLETGYGRTVNYSEDKSGQTEQTPQNALLIPAGLGLSVNLKLPALFNVECFRWVGVNAMAGYRASMYQQDKAYDYQGAYWSLSGAIFLDRIITDLRSWKKHREAGRRQRTPQINY